MEVFERHYNPKSPDILPHTINVNGAPVTDNASIAEAFNEFFITMQQR